jgi:hypothetical protein
VGSNRWPTSSNSWPRHLPATLPRSLQRTAPRCMRTTNFGMVRRQVMQPLDPPKVLAFKVPAARRARTQVPKGLKRTAKAGCRCRRGRANGDGGVENPWTELFLARSNRLWSRLSVRPGTKCQYLLNHLPISPKSPTKLISWCLIICVIIIPSMYCNCMPWVDPKVRYFHVEYVIST